MFPETIDEVLDEVAAGIYLGGARKPFSARTMQRWRQTGEGPEYFLLGPHMVRYTKQSLDKYRESRKRRSTSEAR